uniref:BEACH domain-containing protein n=1 Tax=Rhabditophanes sp. KR3021 TaxID=114890 RepID=A0AC35UG64_9BILA
MDRNTTSILIEKCHGVTEDVDSYVVDDITYKLKLEHYSRLDEQTNVDPITNKCLPMFKENDVPRLLSEFPSKTEDVIEEIAKLLELSWLDMNKINEDNGIEKLEKLVWRPLVKASQMIPIICIIKRQVDYLFVYFDQQNSMASLEQINLFADTTDVFSSKMDLIVTQFLNIFHFFAKHGIFPAFDLSHFSCEKHLWQAIDLYDIVLSIGSSNYENEQIPRIIDTVNMEDKTNNTLEYVTEQWRRGLLTNYDYLMKLNQFAGRNKKNLNYYPIMPWVHDFEGKGDFSLRPLNKSKYRINKGLLSFNDFN